MTRKARLSWLGGLLVIVGSALGAAAGCSSADDGETGGFISDDPNRAEDAPSNGDDSSAAGGAGGTGGAGQGGGEFTEPEDPERLIEEADIIQIDGNRLYALSQYSGLSIIDVSQPHQLELLGRQPLGGIPFEMYLRDGVVYAMFSSWGRYVEVGDGWDWVQSSHVEALNVADPTSITTLGSFDMPGSLSDSRLVGDILYVVTFEDGYCYDCRAEPSTIVTSLTVADPASIGIVDSLAFSDPDESWGGWRRSISVTTERMYVGGIDWGDGVGGQSTIQVVDISDPAGSLVLGDTVEVAGQIQNRWQMDEYQGVLRVVSQPWDTTVFPRVQTFTVVSSFELTALGETQLELPQPESLRSVRFDATKAYAITAEVVVGDPLYTIDLSDPAEPRQVGELQMPGWVYHIEPRGDRLLALGFDEADPDGSLNISLFDVSDMAAPVLVRRIAFGGDWSNFAEDQDRIHKAFKILPEQELVLVPFSAWDWDSGHCSRYESGIQLIDYRDDDLFKRGVAPVRGDARRAFLHEGRLFAMSDEQLRAFDIADRDAPQTVGQLMLSAHVNQVLMKGDHIVRLSADWWTSEPRLEVVHAADPSRLEPIAAVDLGEMLATAEQDDSCYHWSHWNVQLFAHQDSVFLVWPAWNESTARVAAVDMSDPTQPRLGAHLDVPVDVYSYRGYYWSYAPALISAGEPVAQVGSTLVFLSVDVPRDEWGYPDYRPTVGSSHAASLQFVDLSNVDAPRVAAQLELPPGGGHTGLVAQGSRVVLSHWEPVAEQPGKARFYLDRIDVTNPAAPFSLPPINVPGSLVTYDVPSTNMLTVDYQRESKFNVTYEECYDAFGYNAQFWPNNTSWWETGTDYYDVRGTCSMLHRTFRLVHVDELAGEATLLDEQPLPDDVYLGRLLVGDDRVFTVSNGYYYDSDYYPQSLVWAMGGFRDGVIAVHTEPLPDEAGWSYWRPIAAEGQRLIALTWAGGVVTVDAADLGAPEIREHDAVPWYVYSAEFDRDRALLSLGPYGVAVVQLDE